MTFNVDEKVGIRFKKSYGGFILSVFPNHTYGDVMDQLEELATYLVENEMSSVYYRSACTDFNVPMSMCKHTWNEKREEYQLFYA